MLLYNAKLILKEGVLKSLGTLSSKTLDSKAAKGILRYGQLLLGDKTNKRNLNNMLKDVEKNLDGMKVPNMMQRGSDRPAKFHRLEKVKYNNDINFKNFTDLERKVYLKGKLRTNRVIKSLERLYDERRSIKRNLDKSDFNVKLARRTTGAVMGTGALGYGAKKANDKYQESKKSKVEKLKDKIKDIVNKD